MSSPALQSLKAAIDQLIAERDAVKERLDRIDSSLQKIQSSYNVLEALENPQPVESVDKSPQQLTVQRIKHARFVGGKNPDKRDVAAAVAAILMASDRPMLRSDIFEKLKDMGVVINGKDPEMVLSTMLWRVGSEFGIENEKGKGYFIKGKDYGVFG